MHLLVVGASGRTGQLVVSQALSRGHTVAALVRNTSTFQPDGVDPVNPKLKVVQGTPLKEEDVARAFEGQTKVEGVVVSLNTTRASDMPWVKPTSDPEMIADAVRNVTTHMVKHNVKLISFVSSWAAGSSFTSAPFYVRFVMSYTNLYYTLKALEAAEDVLFASDLEYTIVRPTGLSDGKGEGEYKVTEECEGARWFIDRALVARFCLDALEKPDWKRKAVVVS